MQLKKIQFMKKKNPLHKGRRERKFFIRRALYQSTYLRQSTKEITKTEITPPTSYTAKQIQLITHFLNPDNNP